MHMCLMVTHIALQQSLKLTEAKTAFAESVQDQEQVGESMAATSLLRKPHR